MFRFRRMLNPQDWRWLIKHFRNQPGLVRWWQRVGYKLLLAYFKALYRVSFLIWLMLQIEQDSCRENCFTFQIIQLHNKAKGGGSNKHTHDKARERDSSETEKKLKKLHNWIWLLRWSRFWRGWFLPISKNASQN